MANYSKYQQNIIKNYYKNRDAIALQKLQETVSELYLSEGKKRKQVWQRISKHLENVGLKPDHIEHIVQQDDPSLVAKILEDLLAK